MAGFLAAKKLGPDALDDLTLAHLTAALARRKSALLKSALLDQRLTAGLGNWIVDEVLFQARPAPGAPLRRADAPRNRAALRG